jgi:hypothetical protein
VEAYLESWSTMSGGTLWFGWITVEVATKTVEFLLAGGQAHKPDSPLPSASDVAVIFGPARLPEWLRSRPT